MISEGSCDTEDWSNDAQNSALITGIICLYLNIKVTLSVILFHNILLFLMYCIFCISGRTLEDFKPDLHP